MESALDRLLLPGGLAVRFQPMYRLGLSGSRDSLHGVECLVRGPVGSNLHQAAVLFDYVRRKRQETMVDGLCVATILAAAAALPPDVLLSINLHASTLEKEPGFIGMLREKAREAGIRLDRLVLEIVEHSAPWSGARFKRSLVELRDLGIQIAVDDVGRGESNFRMLLDTRPDYFKVDRHLVHGAHEDPYRQAILGSLALLAQRVGASVIAVGVELQEDLETVSQLGIPLAQGHVFAPALPLLELTRSGHLRVVAQ